MGEKFKNGVRIITRTVLPSIFALATACSPLTESVAKLKYPAAQIESISKST